MQCVGEEGLFEDVQDEKVKVLQQMFFGVLLCALATLAAKGDMVFTSIFMGGVAAMAGYWLSDRTTQHLVSLPGVSDHYVWMFFVPLCSASNDKSHLISCGVVLTVLVLLATCGVLIHYVISHQHPKVVPKRSRRVDQSNEDFLLTVC
uniref:Uncharacterized protein n=1 Tax=Hucho hucho TaxID=62062 RepID=A0A4W5Q4U3_9TELE